MNNDTENLCKRIQNIEDLLGIQQLLNRYVFLLQTMQYDTIFDECFSQTREDVSIEASDSGVFIGGKRIRELFFGQFMGMLKTVPGAFTMHFAVNPVIEISDDGCYAKSVAPSPGCCTDPQIRGAQWIWGTFVDDYIKEDGQWRILHHSFVPLFRTPYDKGWTVQPVGTLLANVSNKLGADRPPCRWNPYSMDKKGDELWATLPTLAELKDF